MSFTTTLRQRADAPWTAAVSSRFVRELWAGTLPDTVLATYLAQDSLFVDTFVALIGTAIATADLPRVRIRHARQLGLVANDEDGYFDRALRRLRTRGAGGLGDAAASDVDPSPLAPTEGFLRLMAEARDSQSYALALTVLLVAEWLYLDWGNLALPTPPDWLHADWIDLHRGPGFETWVQLLKDETDRVAELVDAGTRARMEEMFERAVGLERDFFDVTYAAGAGAASVA
ncbi:Protein PET18 [Vanrija pseudolonga]|uniref:Protein PET18 n=1 Tax=Vanrija pseudolonga TaxID=143232 RepID=A0AAF0YED2_9TREE|nr:Protein PET18 [Vanrija pseudolonga]